MKNVSRLAILVLMALPTTVPADATGLSLSQGLLQNQGDITWVLKFKQAGKWRVLSLPPGERKSLGNDKTQLQKMTPAAFGLEENLNDSCEALAIGETTRLYRPLAKASGQMQGAVADASRQIDQGRSKMDDVAKEALKLREKDPDLKYQVESLSTKISYSVDMSIAETLDSQGSLAEDKRLDAEIAALRQQRYRIVEDAKRRNVTQALAERAANSSEATAEKEKIFARQASALAQYEKSFSELLDVYATQLPALRKEFAAEQDYREALLQAMTQEGLLYTGVQRFSAKLKCGNSPFADRLIVTVDGEDPIAPRYVKALADFNSGDTLKFLLVPVAGQDNVFAADFYWPTGGHTATLKIGNRSLTLRRETSLDFIAEDIRSDLKAISAVRRKAKHNSQGGLAQDSAVFGF